MRLSVSKLRSTVSDLTVENRGCTFVVKSFSYRLLQKEVVVFSDAHIGNRGDNERPSCVKWLVGLLCLLPVLHRRCRITGSSPLALLPFGGLPKRPRPYNNFPKPPKSIFHCCFPYEIRLTGLFGLTKQCLKAQELLGRPPPAS